MKNVGVIVKYLLDNRRIIGTIVGSLMILSGYQETGYIIKQMGEV